MRSDAQLQLLHRLMDASEIRHRVLSQNVANVNTPGYHRLDVEFEELLAQELQGSGSSTAGGTVPQVVETTGLPQRADGNNVDIDQEIGQLNKNSLLYQTYAQLLASNLGMMRRAIDVP